MNMEMMPPRGEPVSSAQEARAAIEVRDLRVGYDDREVLHGISFEVRAGETLVILGGS